MSSYLTISDVSVSAAEPGSYHASAKTVRRRKYRYNTGNNCKKCLCVIQLNHQQEDLIQAQLDLLISGSFNSHY